MQKGNRTQGKKFIYTEEQKGAGVTQMSCEDQRIKEAKNENGVLPRGDVVTLARKEEKTSRSYLKWTVMFSV